jgi:hypothetical protein
MVIGVLNPEEIQKNIQWAIETEPLSEQELEAVLTLGETVSSKWAGRYS